MIVFAVLFLIGLGLVVWQASEQASRLTLVNKVIQEMDAVVVVSAAVAILSVDGVKMFAESFLRKRYQDGLKAGEKKALETLVQKKIITVQQRQEYEVSLQEDQSR